MPSAPRELPPSVVATVNPLEPHGGFALVLQNVALMVPATNHLLDKWYALQQQALTWLSKVVLEQYSTKWEPAEPVRRRQRALQQHSTAFKAKEASTS